MLDGEQVVRAPGEEHLRGVVWVCMASIVMNGRPGSANLSAGLAPQGSHWISRPRRPGRGPRRCRARGPRPGAGPSLLVLRAADGLAVDGDDQPAGAGAALVRSQAPRTWSRTSALTRANARRNVDSSAGPRTAPSTATHPARHRRPTARSRRTTATPRSPPRSPRPAAPPASGGLASCAVRDLGEEIEKVLAAGSRHRRRCHRRAVFLVAGDGEREELPVTRPGPSAARDTPGESSAVMT